MPALDKPITIDDNSFERWILQSDLPVALLFCTPQFEKCRRIAPLWQALAAQYAGKLRVAQLMVDDNRHWARQYEVKVLPTTLWFRDGEVRQRAEGLPSEAVLRERAAALLEDRAPRFPEKTKRDAFDSTGGPVILTDATFQEALKDGRPVLVDFWAPWCGPCRMVAPHVESLAKELGDQALVAKVNIDENPGTARQYNVMSIPTLLIFRDGEVADTIVGAQPAQVLRQRLMAQL